MGNDNLGTVPEAIGKTGKLIDLGNGTIITVKKWSAPKFFAVLELISGMIKGLGTSEVDRLKKGGTSDVLEILIKSLGEKVPALIKLSVSKDDVALVDELELEATLDVLEAIIDLNITPNFLKKVQGLGAKLQQVFEGSPSTTQSKLPTDSSAARA